MNILETPRLVLRHLVPAGLPALYALYRDPEMRQYFPDGTRTLEETREELSWILKGHPRHSELGLWAAVEKQSGAFLGRCRLLPWRVDERDEVELAFLIDKARCGQGLATEASLGIIDDARDRLGLDRLIGLISPGNQPGGRGAQGGMRFERECTDEYGLCHIHGMRLHTPNQPNAVAPS